MFQVPDTGFSCDGQVEGGKYADPGAECQVGNTSLSHGVNLHHLAASCRLRQGLEGAELKKE